MTDDNSTPPPAPEVRPLPPTGSTPPPPPPAALPSAPLPPAPLPPAASRPAQPGFPPAPGYPQAPALYGCPQAPLSGRPFWALMFLVYIPLVGFLIAMIVALVQRAGASSSPHEIVRQNARWAANWAISAVFYVICFMLLVIVLAPTFAGSTSDAPPVSAVVLGLLIPAFGVYYLVTIIIGTVKSNHAVHRPMLAIPFLRG